MKLEGAEWAGGGMPVSCVRDELHTSVLSLSQSAVRQRGNPGHVLTGSSPHWTAGYTRYVAALIVTISGGIVKAIRRVIRPKL